MSAQSDDEQTKIPESQNPNFTSDHQNPQSLESSQPFKTLTLDSPPSPHLSDDADIISTPIGLCRGGGGGGKRKKQKRRPAAERRLQEKLKHLSENMNPVVFVPAKRLDFASHEGLLRRVGLWDFVNLEFDCSIRGDLVAQLIASYSSDKRCGYVNEFRIMVNRADLARALKLPARRERGSVQAVSTDDSVSVKESRDSVIFLDDFVSNWVLLHGDAWIMPDEILNWIKMIKEGNFEKVDWAGMIWFMVEKELGTQQLTDCFYASHLQQLIKFQKEVLFEEGPSLEADAKDDVDVKEEEEEEEDEGGADVKMGEVGDLVRGEVEEKNIELSLGLESVERDDAGMEEGGKDDVMDLDGGREEETGHWLIDGKNDAGRHFLQPCGQVGASNSEADRKDFGVIDDEYNIEEEELEAHDVNDDDGEEQEEGDDGDEEVEEQDGEFQIMQKCDGLGSLSSSNLIQAMEAQNAFSSGVQFRDDLSNDFMLSRVDTDVVAGSSIFGDNGKRHVSHVADMSNHSLNGSNKRPRIDEPADFLMCMEQIQNWVGKARMMYETKEQAFSQANMQQQAFISEIQQRDAVISQIHKARIEEQQRNQTQINRYEHELSMMVGLLENYRKALKETHKAFAEYRALCPLPKDEPLYKDVSGSGGLVLSSMELEKQRIKREEEERMMRVFYEKTINDFETCWLKNFEGCFEILDQIDNRFVGLDHEVNLLKERIMKRKVEAPNCKVVEGSEFIGIEHSKSKVAEAEEQRTSPEAVVCSAPAESVECSTPEDVKCSTHAEAVKCSAPSKNVEFSACNAPTDNVEGIALTEDNAPTENMEFSVPTEDNAATENMEFSVPTEDNAPTKNMEFNVPTEDNAPTENMEFSVPTEDNAFNVPTENMEFNVPTEDVECNIPKENMESSVPTEDMELNAPTGNMECSVPTEDVECKAPRDNMECSVPTEEVEVSDPAQNMECVAKEVKVLSP